MENNFEIFKLIGKFLEEAERYGRYVYTIIGSYDKQELAPYFARKSASAALKAISLIDSLQLYLDDYFKNVFYCSLSINSNELNKINTSGWYFLKLTGRFSGPYASSGLAIEAREKYLLDSK